MHRLAKAGRRRPVETFPGLVLSGDVANSIGKLGFASEGVGALIETGSEAESRVAKQGERFSALATGNRRANLDGSGVDRGFIAPSFTDLMFPAETTVAVDGAHIYWTTSAGIARANLDGTGVDPSFMTLLGRPRAMAVDDAHIYWTTLTGIGRANLDGTSVDPKFITWPPCWEGQARGLAVDGAYLYWSSREEPPPLGGNRFALGKVKWNARKGTARLAVKVRYRGQLSLAGTERVEAVSEKIKEPGWVRLPIRPKGAAKQRLATRGRATVKLAITFQGFQGSIGCPVTKSRKLTLVKRG